MIKIARIAEPAGLAARRVTQLRGLGPTRPDRTPAHCSAYQSVKSDLVEMQLHKCCYCDRRTIPDHNDVEHYRPFGLYWWLAWTWENLLFACAACNRSGGKLDQFPLGAGSVQLPFAEQPPGAERPLLVDPSVDDPREHIRFARMPEPAGRWEPIGISERGRETIKILGLSRDTYLDDFRHHVESTVMPVVRDIQDIQHANDTETRIGFPDYWRRKCMQLLDPNRALRALSEDVLRHEFPTFPDPPT